MSGYTINVATVHHLQPQSSNGTATYLQGTIPGSRLQGSRSSVQGRVKLAPSRAAPKPAAPAKKARDNSTAMGMAGVVSFAKSVVKDISQFGEGKGYISISGGRSFLIRVVPVGVSVGIKVDGKGNIHPFVTGGISLPPGFDWALMYSRSAVSKGCTANLNLSYYASASFATSGLQEIGLASQGVSAGAECVW